MVALALAGCSQPQRNGGTLVISAIGAAPAYASPARASANLPSRLLIDATAQGLVRFDAAGQIEPGLAERWIVIDDGLTYIFRLRRAKWADGAPLTADQIVSILRRQLAPGARNPLARFLSAIGEIVTMTPQVIEVRLKRPRPDLLKLFAQPELGLVRLRSPAGTGPMRIERGGAAMLLAPLHDPMPGDSGDGPAPELAIDPVALIGEDTPLALARFAARQSDLVVGGTFADWPLVANAGVPPANIRTEAASGLFGLAIVAREGFLADPANRTALAEAVDRSTLIAAALPGARLTEQLLPEALDSATAPAAPNWTALALADRQTEARARVAAWQGAPVRLRIALPAGPGSTLVFAALAASFARIGITSERIPLAAAPADLRLIDAVAPYDSARWYLATVCQACSPEAQAALTAARNAPTMADRAAKLTVADRVLTDDVAYIPIARPLRWSLVALRLTQWQPNPRAWHPLNHLDASPAAQPAP